MKILRLKITVLELIESGDANSLLASIGLLGQVLEENDSFLSAQVIQRITALLLKSDRNAALRWGKNILENVWSRLDIEACKLMHRLLFPTIFDHESAMLIPAQADIANKKYESGPGESVPLPMAQPNNPSIDVPTARKRREDAGQVAMQIQQSVGSLRNALGMIDLEICSADVGLAKDREAHLSKAIIEGCQNTISSRLYWDMLSTLLQRSQVDTYFVLFGTIVAHYGKVPFVEALLEHMDRQVIPKLKYVLAQAIETQRPSLVIRATMLILTVVGAAKPLPSGLEPYLIDKLRRLMRAISNENYRNHNGFTALQSQLDVLMRQTDFSNEGIGREIIRLHSLINSQ